MLRKGLFNKNIFLFQPMLKVTLHKIKTSRLENETLGIFTKA